jgi:Serine/threonine protein kinase
MAEDSRLDRKVAIKVLPADFAKDEDRLKRFEQEAKATSALNHPNILTVHDIGEHDGNPYIVSELLEGEELRDLLNERTIPVRKTIEYAQQIVSGLSAAHEKGIVHRDLKPENLFITNDDRVKILDFGLAKLRERTTETSGSEDATRKAITDPGMVMGTVGYMSPEQVRGQAADYRSDIFSFGVILYEMLTGKRAFHEETMAETMTAILKGEPKEIAESTPNVSPSFERIVRRCLEKKPDRRFQSTSDLGFALESLSASTNSSGTSIPGIAVEPESARRIRRPILYSLGLFLVVIGAIAGILGFSYFRKSQLPLYEQLTFRRGLVYHARFAPDGQTLVYSGAWNGNPLEIFSTRAGLSESRSLGLTDADVLAISSTGEMAVLVKRQFLGQLTYKGTLARVPMMGGTPREILEDVEEADWSPDGKDLAVIRYVDGRNRLEYPIGKVLYETSGYISYPRISPKGDRIAFMDHDVLWDNRGRVATVDLAGNKSFISEEFAGEEGLAWSASGDEVWFTASTAEANSLFAATLSGQTRLVLRVPADMILHDITRDGHLLLTRYKQTTDVIGMAPGETTERDLSWLDFGGVDDLSADGKNFVFTYWGQGSGTNYSTYLAKTDGSPGVRLGEGGTGKLSPDGKWVLAVLSEPSQMILLPTGAGESRRLEKYGIEQYDNPPAWLPDGKQILFAGRESGHVDRCYVQSIDSGGPRPITPEGVTGRIVSPDGRSLIAFDRQGKAEIYPIEGDEKPRPIPGLGDRDTISRWSGDGHSLYVYPDGLPVKVSRLDLATGRKELLKEVMPADRAGIFFPPSILLTPDGKGYIYAVRRYLMDLYLVDGLK